MTAAHRRLPSNQATIAGQRRIEYDHGDDGDDPDPATVHSVAQEQALTEGQGKVLAAQGS